jgi:hypothetical protein
MRISEPKGPQGQKRPADLIARQSRQVMTLIAASVALVAFAGQLRALLQFEISRVDRTMPKR